MSSKSKKKKSLHHPVIKGVINKLFVNFFIIFVSMLITMLCLPAKGEESWLYRLITSTDLTSIMY